MFCRSGWRLLLPVRLPQVGIPIYFPTVYRDPGPRPGGQPALVAVCQVLLELNVIIGVKEVVADLVMHLEIAYIMLEEGRKIELDAIPHATGGGATNTACSFQKLLCIWGTGFRSFTLPVVT